MKKTRRFFRRSTSSNNEESSVEERKEISTPETSSEQLNTSFSSDLNDSIMMEQHANENGTSNNKDDAKEESSVNGSSNGLKIDFPSDCQNDAEKTSATTPSSIVQPSPKKKRRFVRPMNTTPTTTPTSSTSSSSAFSSVENQSIFTPQQNITENSFKQEEEIEKDVSNEGLDTSIAEDVKSVNPSQESQMQKRRRFVKREKDESDHEENDECDKEEPLRKESKETREVQPRKKKQKPGFHLNNETNQITFYEQTFKVKNKDSYLVVDASNITVDFGDDFSQDEDVKSGVHGLASFTKKHPQFFDPEKIKEMGEVKQNVLS